MSYFISFGVFEKQISQLSTIFRIGKRDARLIMRRVLLVDLEQSGEGI